MTYFEVLVEGASDVPALQEILERRFGLSEHQHFRIHPHKGKGSLPLNPLSTPDPRHQGLLHQLPAKLRGFGRYLTGDSCVLVVVDADDTPFDQLLGELNSMLSQLPTRPPKVLFKIAVEETESWFIADLNAVQSAYPKARLQRLRSLAPDATCGAWEALASALGYKAEDVTGADKHEWAKAIVPYLDLHNPPSPSLATLIEDIEHQTSEMP